MESWTWAEALIDGIMALSGVAFAHSRSLYVVRVKFGVIWSCDLTFILSETELCGSGGAAFAVNSVAGNLFDGCASTIRSFLFALLWSGNVRNLQAFYIRALVNVADGGKQRYRRDLRVRIWKGTTILT